MRHNLGLGEDRVRGRYHETSKVLSLFLKSFVQTKSSSNSTINTISSQLALKTGKHVVGKKKTPGYEIKSRTTRREGGQMQQNDTKEQGPSRPSLEV